MNFGRNRGWAWNGFQRTKALISLKRDKMGPRIDIEEKKHAFSIGAKINYLG